jgi:hypothetical protein
MEASYTFSEVGLPSATWTFSPTCVPVCPVSSPECTRPFDDATLSGTHTVTWTPQCGMPAGMTKTPFSLSFVGPLDAPVTRYPLQCNPFGVCR